MTDKRDPDMTDIDAFLIEDSTVGKANADLPAEAGLRNPTSRPLRNKDPIARLNSRITHATRNITTALTSAHELSESLEDDQKGCDAFGDDIRDWDTVISGLENVIHHLPENTDIQATDEPEDSLHENIADAIASHLDTELQDASEGPTEIVATEENAEENAEVLPDRDQVSEEDDATTSSEQDELLRSIEKQEARIRELEEQLESVQSTGTHSNPSGEPSNLSERGDNNPNVNRLIVAMNGSENTKHPLSRNIMTIGREPHNDIHIRSRYISRFHARIVSDQDGSIIEDLDSRNGVKVNSKKVRRRQLKSGDLIDLGRVQLKYIDLMEGSASEGRA
jgi:hypothetical protein